MPGIVSHKLKVVYWFIPKNACTSFKKYFAEVERIAYDYIHDAPFEYVTDFNAYPDYFHFTVVRHPMERLLSLYKNKIQPDGRTDEYFINGVERVVLDYRMGFNKDMSFNDFCKVIIHIPHHLRDPHYAEQWIQFKPFNCYIIRMEELSTELKKLESILQIKDLPIENQTDKKIFRQCFLSPSMTHAVVSFYHQDFIRFNYE
jgi:hypothetical protein